VAAAHAIVDIAVAKMSLAVREVSVVKGLDPRDFALVASGGAGPLHVSAIARELNVPKVIIPRFPSHFSALGMLLADERHDLVRTCYCDLGNADFTWLLDIHDDMAAQAETALRHGVNARRRVTLDIRHVGQEFTLPVPVDREQLLAADRASIRSAFDALYDQRYAHHSPDEPVEIVNMRMMLIGRRPKISFPPLREERAARPTGNREVYFGNLRDPVSCPIYHRDKLGIGNKIDGPALIQETGTTTLLFPTDCCTVMQSGELVIAIGG
jgi:N-methylhydantoinase A